MKLQEKVQGVIDFQKIYENSGDDFNWLEFAQDYAEHYYTQQLAIDSVSMAKRTFTAEQVLAILEDTEHLDDAKMMFVRSEL